MALPEIRPLSFGETLDRSFALYRRHFLVLATICLIPGLLIQLVNLPLELLSDTASTARPAFGYAAIVTSILLFFVYMFIQFLTMAAAVFAISEIYLGRDVTVGAAIAKMMQRVWAMLGLWINIGIRMLLCAVTIILIPLILLLTYWYCFAIPVSLVEKVSSGEALKRSRHLTKGLGNQIFLTFLLMSILTYIVALVFQSPFMFLSAKFAMERHAIPLWLTVLTGLMGAFAGALTTPPLMVALTLLYFNTRVVREGYDLQLMLERLGSGIAAGVAPAAPPATPPAPIPNSTGAA